MVRRSGTKVDPLVLTILCEDSQHEAFARRVLEKLGLARRAFRVSKCPRGAQSAEQWVRDKYCEEVRALRSKIKYSKVHLVVIIDAEKWKLNERKKSLDDALCDGGTSVRRDKEPIAIFVPARRIETWLAYLGGGQVDESTEFPKLRRERDCGPAAGALADMCRMGELRHPAPMSLADACEEYDRIRP